MAKSTQSLSGAAKDAFLARVADQATGLDPAAAKVLVERLQRDVTRVWVKATAVAVETAAESPAEPVIGEPPPEMAGFNPFALNVVVIIRKKGRDSALAALAGIARPEQLRLLAREQQLGLDPSLTSAHEIRAAIVAAAERRIANRRAAAG